MDKFDKLFEVFDTYSDIRIRQLAPNKCKCLCCSGDIVIFSVDGNCESEIGRGESLQQAINNCYDSL